MPVLRSRYCYSVEASIKQCCVVSNLHYCLLTRRYLNIYREGEEGEGRREKRKDERRKGLGDVISNIQIFKTNI